VRPEYSLRSASCLRNFAIVISCAAALHGSYLRAQPVTVHQTEGALHGFLSLTAPDGAVIADGDLEQTAHGSRVTSRLTFHFKDGSLQDETTVFSQTGHFHLLSDHLIQKGPTFKRQMDLTVNGATGASTARYSDEKGKEKVETVQLTLPPDLANGMVPILLKNLAPGAPLNASMIVPAPKPTLVKLEISPEGEDSFVTGGTRQKATRYLVHISIGGIKGVIAPLVGKQPPDTKVWVMGGAAPTYLKSVGSSCEDCAIWGTQLVSPAWPQAGDASAERKK
jgi:hypothetical protein